MGEYLIKLEDIERYIVELLHINDERKNKLVDLNCATDSTYFLTRNDTENLAYVMLEEIKEKYGKIGTTVLRNSVVGSQNFGIGRHVFDWQKNDGTKDVEELNKFIADKCYKEMLLKGNNPLFLSIGTVRWEMTIKEDEKKEFLSPLIIFPIKLIRSGKNQQVAIEFVEDDVYFNPCFYYKLKNLFGEDVVKGFPLPPECNSIEAPININVLDIDGYFDRVASYIENCRRADVDNKTLFELNPNVVAISVYRHEDFCMYHDIRRNIDVVCSHPMITRIFEKCEPLTKNVQSVVPRMVLPADSAQEGMIRRAVNGDSFVIQGPPGSGKTLTIANMIASLIGAGKKVMFVSQKISALSEVYNKLPERLKKFVLPLYCESEADAARLKPESIQANLKEALAEPEKIVGSLENREAVANGQKNESLISLGGYYQKMYENNTNLGMFYYDILKTYLKNENITVVDFNKSEEWEGFNKVLDKINMNGIDISSKLKEFSLEFLKACNTVQDIEKYYYRLTRDNKYLVRQSPWYGFKNISAFIDKKTKLDFVYELKNYLENLSSDINFSIDNITLDCLRQLAKCSFSEEEMKQLLAKKDFAKYFENIIKKHLYYELNIEGATLAYNYGADTQNEEVGKVDINDELNYKIKIETVKKLVDKKEAIKNFASKDSLTKKFNEILACYEECQKEMLVQIDVVESIFKKQALSDENFVELIQKSYAKLVKYIEQGIEKPSGLDFGAKKTFKKLEEYVLSKKVDFKGVCKAVDAYKKYDDKKAKIADLLEEAKLLLRCDLDAEELAGLLEIYKALEVESKNGIFSKVNLLIDEYDNFVSIKNDVLKISLTDCTINELYSMVAGVKAIISLRSAIEKLVDEVPTNKGKLEQLAESLVGFAIFYTQFTAFNSYSEDVLLKYLHSVVEGVRKLNKNESFVKCVDTLESFIFVNYDERAYYYNFENMTVGDFNIFQNDIEDKDLGIAMMEYESKCKSINYFDLKDFFAPFINGDNRENSQCSFKDIFEHSVCGTVLREQISCINMSRTRLEDIFNNLQKAEDELRDVNVGLIEKNCSSSIKDKKDSKYDFLSSNRSKFTNSRGLFKQKASEIMSLKKCFILSPSSVSIYFRPEIYKNFDVAIIDEASQIAPQYILPVAFRAKQCIIVGDEYQMPPIKHFDRVDNTKEDDEIIAVESILDLTKVNESFSIEPLVCHFRSRSEELISYSQNKYYDYMLTFPAVEPHRDDIGVTDCFVENGCSENGQNVAEANKVVEILEKHFNLYYDEETKLLSRSIGIVTFGVKQQDLVLNMIKNKAELRQKIDQLNSTALIPEKQFFIRTIEKVQGQEIDDLVLSITYGRGENGKIRQNFGQLNQGSLGEKIFNVAVTRAIKSITVIHSLKYYEMDTPSLAYIKEYLAMTEFFSNNEERGFVTTKADNEFVISVAKAVEELGVPSDRVVVNYGVTKNSLRIPIAILSEDKTKAVLGIMCEAPIKRKAEMFVDYMMRYPNILRTRGWSLYNIFIYDWYSNNTAEKNMLKQILKKHEIIN